MVTLDWDLDRADGVTLVRLFVESPRRCRVRIENRLDGPVWPPRRRGQPAAGWDDDGYTGVVPADGLLTVGYSTSAPPDEPPAEVVSTEAADEPDGTRIDAPDRDGQVRRTERSDRANEPRDAPGRSSTAPAPAVDASPAGVVRTLGDPVIPRDCVPLPASDGTMDPAERDGDRRTGGRRPASGTSAGPQPSPTADPGRRSGVETNTPFARADADRQTTDGLVVPGAVRAWLRDVERRLEAVDDAGNPDRNTESNPDLAAAVATDRRALAWLTDRVEALAARADEAGIDAPAARTDGSRVDPPDEGVR
jgi:hypothetical protein